MSGALEALGADMLSTFSAVVRLLLDDDGDCCVLAVPVLAPLVLLSAVEPVLDAGAFTANPVPVTTVTLDPEVTIPLS